MARFQVFLGGTSVPYLNRLAVIDELLIEGEGRPSLSSLAVKALARVADLHATRSGGSPLDEGLPEVEWHPSSGREHFDCVKEAIIRLNNIARKKLANFQEDLLPTAENLSTLLRQASVRNLVVSFFDALREEYHEAREPLRKIIADVIYREKDYWKEMPSEELGELEELHARFEDSSLEAQAAAARWAVTLGARTPVGPKAPSRGASLISRGFGSAMALVNVRRCRGRLAARGGTRRCGYERGTR